MADSAKLTVPASLRTKLFSALQPPPAKTESYAQKKIVKSPSSGLLPEMRHKAIHDTNKVVVRERVNSHDAYKFPLALSAFTRNLILSQQQLKAAEENVERYRVLLREKELDIVRTRNENALLKQVRNKFTMFFSWNENIKKKLRTCKTSL